MIKLAKIRQAAQKYSHQELCAASIYQQQFNNFNGQEIVTDLIELSELWCSFFFTTSLDDADQKDWRFYEIMETLVSMSINRAAQEIKRTDDAPYPANNLYVLAPKKDTTLTLLLTLAKKWRADAVAVYSDDHHEVGCSVQVYPPETFEATAWSKNSDEWKDGVVISYWWSNDVSCSLAEYNEMIKTSTQDESLYTYLRRKGASFNTSKPSTIVPFKKGRGKKSECELIAKGVNADDATVLQPMPVQPKPPQQLTVQIDERWSWVDDQGDEP